MHGKKSSLRSVQDAGNECRLVSRNHSENHVGINLGTSRFELRFPSFLNKPKGWTLAMNGKNASTQKEVRCKNENGSITTSKLRALLESQKYRCALTSWPLTPETTTVDHIVPLSNGGAHDISNLQFVHFAANRAKGTMAQEEFISLCVAVAAKHHGSFRGQKN